MNNLIVDESLLFKVGVIAIFIHMGSLGRISGISIAVVLLWWWVAASDSLITLCVSYVLLVALLALVLALILASMMSCILLAAHSFLVKHVCLSVLIQIEEFRMDHRHLLQS